MPLGSSDDDFFFFFFGSSVLDSAVVDRLAELPRQSAGQREFGAAHRRESDGKK